MSLTGALVNSLSGIHAVQAQIQIVSNNISNANTVGYARQTANLIETSTAAGVGGVSVQGVTRASDNVLSTAYRQALGDSNLASTQQDYAQRIQSLLGGANTSAGTPLATDITNLQTAWRTLATTPEDGTAQQAVIGAAKAFANDVTTTATGLDKIKASAVSDIGDAVNTLNTSLKNIVTLNGQIAAAQNAGQDASSLEDQRDAEINTVAGLVQINVFQRNNGSVGIYTPQGTSLLDISPAQFTWNGSNITDANGNDATNLLGGGKIEGLLSVVDPGTSASSLADPTKAPVAKVAAQLDQLVSLFNSPTGTFETAFSTTSPGTGELGSAFFTAGTTRYNFSVNSQLTTNALQVPQSTISATADDFDVNTRNITAGDIKVTNGTYADFANAIITQQSNNTSTVKANATTYSAQSADFQKQLQDATGVNVDDEVAKLSSLQNNYAAVARVISTVNQMFTTLEGISTT